MGNEHDCFARIAQGNDLGLINGLHAVHHIR